MENLNDIRAQIDKIDCVISAEYAKRLALTRKVGEIKRQSGAEVAVAERERAVLENAVQCAGEENRTAISYLYRDILDYSKEEQLLLSGKGDRFLSQILVRKEGEQCERAGSTVACQGLQGAYSSLAANLLFSSPNIVFYHNFEGVFAAVQAGEAQFGVVPIENSTAGSVNEVYDLLTAYGLNICAAKKVHISHCLVGVPGATLNTITEVYSHPQALQQCKKSLDKLNILMRHEVTNTAVAAQKVSELHDKTKGAIASELTAELYGLQIIARAVQDEVGNDTRFIVVTQQKSVSKEANKISLVVSIDHREGALHRLLGIFAAAGKNLLKLESRPIPNQPFEFLFYVDLEAKIEQPETQKMLQQVGAYCKTALFLGAYFED